MKDKKGDLEKYYFEQKHDKRFKATFWMFVVIAVVLGLVFAFTVTNAMLGYSIWTDLFGPSESAGAKPNASTVPNNTYCAFIGWENSSGNGETGTNFCLRKGYHKCIYTMHKDRTVYYDSVNRNCDGRKQSIEEIWGIVNCGSNYLGYAAHSCTTVLNSSAEPLYGDVETVIDGTLKGGQPMIFCCP